MEWRKLIGVAAAVLGAPAAGEETGAWDLNVLKLEEEKLRVIQESMHKSRHQLARTAGDLSAVIDSLKRGDPGSEEMRLSFLQSMEIERLLLQVDQEIEQMSAAEDSLRERLRLAYDWEISRLLAALSESPDQGLLVQLMILWDERQKLGYDVIEPELARYPVDMTIAASDGPEEIRQKLALLEDRISLLREEGRQLEKRIRRMENQGRMEKEVWSLARRLLPEGGQGAAVHLASDGGLRPPADSPETGRGLIEVRGKGVVAPGCAAGLRPATAQAPGQNEGAEGDGSRSRRAYRGFPRPPAAAPSGAPPGQSLAALQPLFAPLRGPGEGSSSSLPRASTPLYATLFSSPPGQPPVPPGRGSSMASPRPAPRARFRASWAIQGSTPSPQVKRSTAAYPNSGQVWIARWLSRMDTTPGYAAGREAVEGRTDDCGPRLPGRGDHAGGDQLLVVEDFPRTVVEIDQHLPAEPAARSQTACPPAVPVRGVLRVPVRHS